jgi:prolipoprotein diacylglyceryltransferase
MYPELFRIGSFTVQSYGFMILTGVLLAWWYMYRHTGMHGPVDEDVSCLFLFSKVFDGGDTV